MHAIIIYFSYRFLFYPSNIKVDDYLAFYRGADKD